MDFFKENGIELITCLTIVAYRMSFVFPLDVWFSLSALLTCLKLVKFSQQVCKIPSIQIRSSFVVVVLFTSQVHVIFSKKKKKTCEFSLEWKSHQNCLTKVVPYCAEAGQTMLLNIRFYGEKKKLLLITSLIPLYLVGNLATTDKMYIQPSCLFWELLKFRTTLPL